MKKKELIFHGLLVIIPVVLGLGVYGGLIEPYRVDVHHIWIEDHHLGKLLKGKLVVQVSDIHMNTIGRREQRVLEILKKLEPDFVFLTGDYVQWGGNYEEVLTYLSKLKAKIGVWAVMGDYDYSCSRKSCLFCHEPGNGKPTSRHKVRFLRNEMEQVELEKGSIWIGAMDKEALKPFAENLSLVKGWDNKPTILLSHNPLMFDDVSENQEILILAGDTHGGQIPIPSWLWQILGYEKNARYSHGLFEKGRKKMFVSRGVGTSHIPFRIFRRPEVVVLHFSAERTNDDGPRPAFKDR